MRTLSDRKVRHATLSYLGAINLFLRMLQLAWPVLLFAHSSRGRGGTDMSGAACELQQHLTRYSALPFTCIFPYEDWKCVKTQGRV